MTGEEKLLLQKSYYNLFFVVLIYKKESRKTSELKGREYCDPDQLTKRP
jgi:hypothetical protein